MHPYVDEGARVSDRQEEFTQVYRRDGLRWVRLAYAVAGNQRHAEDAVAEAAARVWPRFRDGKIDDVASYMGRAVVNEALAHGRRHAVRERLFARRMSQPREPAVEEAVEHHQLVLGGLMRLPPNQRAAIALRFLEDLSEAETASALGVSPGTVKSRVHRGLQALREVLQEVSADGR